MLGFIIDRLVEILFVSFIFLLLLVILKLKLFFQYAYTVNQKVCSSHQIKRESLVTIVTPKYGVMRTPHRLGVKYTPNLV